MEDNFTINLGDVAVRFTPDGKVYIIDAIQALSNASHPNVLWRDMKRENPEINSLFENFRSDGNTMIPVTDSDGWDKIQDYLIEHLMEMEYEMDKLAS